MRVFLCQHCGIFPKMHIASIQIGDVFIGVHRKLQEWRVFGRAFLPQPPRLHGQSSWLVKLLFFRWTLAGKHASSQATTHCSPSQYGCPAEEPIEGRHPASYILTGASISRFLSLCPAWNLVEHQACLGKKGTHCSLSDASCGKLVIAALSIKMILLLCKQAKASL